MTAQEKLALACRILAVQGHNDMIYGHVSALTDAPGQHWIIGRGVPRFYACKSFNAWNDVSIGFNALSGSNLLDAAFSDGSP